MPNDSPFLAQSGGYSFVVKQMGNHNLRWFNALKAYSAVKDAVAADKAAGKTLSTVKFDIHDPIGGKNYLEGIVGFYDTEVLIALQDCPH